ncbi:MAG: SDR family oxidoreductase [Bacilli bacterium]|nr:SDR family oxidoreductase [Bacilli bacterium]
MKALITGASSGIGREMAKYLASLGHDLILVGRSKEQLEKLQNELKVDTQIVIVDLSDQKKVKELYVIMKNENIDILINNAGFGDFGNFYETDINRELEMINTNIVAVHLLTKLFLRDMKKRDSGYILNVASIAAFGPGPLMATYYATKAYVNNLTEAIYEELRREKSNVHISSLCPGPTASKFFDRAGVTFAVKPMECEEVAKYGIDKMFKGKVVIVPGFFNKCSIFFRRFASRGLIRKVTYKLQKAKKK